MKWRCRIFEQRKRFISWFIYRASRPIYRLFKIQIGAQRSSNPGKQIHKILTKRKPTKSHKRRNLLISVLIPCKILTNQKRLIFFEFANRLSEISLNKLSFSSFGLKVDFQSICYVFTFFEADFLFSIFQSKLFSSFLFFFIIS